MKKQILEDHRAARFIGQCLSSATSDPPDLDALSAAWEHCKRWHSRLRKASAKGWKHAANESARRLTASLEELHALTARLIKQSHGRSYAAVPISVADVYHDIQSLRREFVAVTLDLKERTLAVETDEITLDGVYLGAFKIKLLWGHKQGAARYRVLAISPNPSAANSEVTHPHVQRETLCEGDGMTSIKRALEDGRLFDFFCIVDRILKTYNSGSAYVELSDWRGIDCHDCGQSTDSDETHSCDDCDSVLCGSCARHCGQCRTTHCSDCIRSCNDCGNDYCDGCLDSCSHCGSDFCSHCLTHKVCHDCFNEEEAYEAEESQPLASGEHPLSATDC